MSTLSDVAAVVLAGGQSSRFGSDKALATFRGEALVTRLCDQLLKQVGNVALAAKQPDAYRLHVPSKVALLRDSSSDPNPLSGLQAGLEWAPCEFLFMMACDMPFGATDGLMTTLRDSIAENSAVAFSWQGVPQPLCALYRVAACLPAITPVAVRGRGPRQLLADVNARLIPYASVFAHDTQGLPFQDVDTPEALAALK